MLGFEITSKRINDIGFEVNLVDSISRGEFLKKLQRKNRVVFTADSFTDSLGLKMADVSFAPKNAHPIAKKNATMILNSNGGAGAVAEVCLLYLCAIGQKF